MDGICARTDVPKKPLARRRDPVHHLEPVEHRVRVARVFHRGDCREPRKDLLSRYARPGSAAVSGAVRQNCHVLDRKFDECIGGEVVEVVNDPTQTPGLQELGQDIEVLGWPASEWPLMLEATRL